MPRLCIPRPLIITDPSPGEVELHIIAAENLSPEEINLLIKLQNSLSNHQSTSIIYSGVSFSESNAEPKIENATTANWNTILYVDPMGRVLNTSDPALALVKSSREIWIGKLVNELLPEFHSFWHEFVQNGCIHGELSIRLPDDHLHQIEYHIQASVLPGCHAIYMRDVSHYRVLAGHDAQIVYEEYQLAEALRTSLKAISSSLDFDTVMMHLLSSVKQVVPNDQSNIMLIEDDIGRVAYCSFCKEGKDHAPHTHEFSLEIATLRSMLTTKEPCLIEDTRHSHQWLYIEEEKNVLSYLGVPINIDDAVIGFLNLNSFQLNAFSPTDVQHLKLFADEAAIAIKNARLYEKTQHSAVELKSEVEKRTWELFDAREHAETIFNSSNDAILVIARDGKLKQANPAFDERFTTEVNPDQTRYLSDLIFLEDQTRLMEAFKQLLHRQEAQRLEIRMMDKCGTLFEVDMVLSPMVDNTGQIIEILCSLRDISQQKALLTHILENLEKEQHINELKSRIVSIVSHDLRNPLTAILSSVSLLRQYRARLSDEVIDKKFEGITEQIVYMNDLLEDILTMGHVESDEFQLRYESVDMAILCQEVIDALHLICDQMSHIQLESQMICPPVQADRRLIYQVMDNLLSNAIKYSPENQSVRISLGCDGESVILSVSDQGIGIPEGEQSRIFDGFHRASNVGSIRGTGLGLAIAKRAIELHKGAISVDSQVGLGTTFTVWLPINSI